VAFAFYYANGVPVFYFGVFSAQLNENTDEIKNA